MFAAIAQSLGLNARRCQSFAGLAAAIIPCSILVHLAAELAALGQDGLDAGFIVRHGYFGALFAISALWFGATVGLGRGPAERRRRCALLRAQAASRPRWENLLHLIAANLGFFAVTQAIEGVPVAGGAVVFGLSVALAGSLLAAVLVFLFGRALVAAGCAVAIAISPRQRVAVICTECDRAAGTSRGATAHYSLFIPNRPPPLASRF